MDAKPALPEQRPERQATVRHVRPKGAFQNPELLAQPGHQLIDRRQRQAALRELAHHALALAPKSAKAILGDAQIAELDPEVSPLDLRVKRGDLSKRFRMHSTQEARLVLRSGLELTPFGDAYEKTGLLTKGGAIPSDAVLRRTG